MIPESTANVPASADETQMLTLSAPPYLRSKDSVVRIMCIVLAALVPAMAVAVMLYGVPVLASIILCIGAATATDFIIGFARLKKLPPFDGSAAVTGALLALSLPPQAPLWLAPAGALFAVAIVKMLAGGPGSAVFNPALAGRAFLAAAFPAAFAASAVSGQPFALLDTKETLLNFLVGFQGGWIGSTSMGALILGAALLWFFRIIDVILPLAFIGSAYFLFWLTNSSGSLVHALAFLEPLALLLSGGTVLAAIFMATDPVTSPSIWRARLPFGIGCGVATFLLQKNGAGTGGVVYAVLLMNCTVPLLDRLLMYKPFGSAGKNGKRRITENNEPAPEPAGNGPAAEGQPGAVN
jgi:Na+-translocating ferredoxin:NAD+ oxidoreductase subunit D